MSNLNWFAYGVIQHFRSASGPYDRGTVSNSYVRGSQRPPSDRGTGGNSQRLFRRAKVQSYTVRKPLTLYSRTTKKEKEVADAGCEDWNPPTQGGEAVENHRWNSDCARGAVCHRQLHELSVAFPHLIISQPYVSEHIRLPSQKFSLILPYRTPRCVVPQRRINTGKSACRLRSKNWEVRYIRKAFTWRFISWL